MSKYNTVQGGSIGDMVEHCAQKGIGYFAVSKVKPLIFLVPPVETFSSTQSTCKSPQKPGGKKQTPGKKCTVAEKLAGQNVQGSDHRLMDVLESVKNLLPSSNSQSRTLAVGKKKQNKMYKDVMEKKCATFMENTVNFGDRCIFFRVSSKVPAPLYLETYTVEHVVIPQNLAHNPYAASIEEKGVEEVFQFKFMSNGRVSCPLLNSEIQVFDRQENVKKAKQAIQWLSHEEYIYFDLEGMYVGKKRSPSRILSVVQVGAFDYTRMCFVAYIFCYPVMKIAEIRHELKNLFERGNGFVVGFSIHPNMTDSVMLQDIGVDMTKVKSIDAQHVHIMFFTRDSATRATHKNQKRLDVAWMSVDSRLEPFRQEVEAACDALRKNVHGYMLGCQDTRYADNPDQHLFGGALFKQRQFRLLQYIILDVIETYAIALLSREPKYILNTREVSE